MSERFKDELATAFLAMMIGISIGAVILRAIFFWL